MRLAILSNVNLDMLSGLLKKEYEVFLPEGYGGWVTYALGRREDMAAFGADCIFLLLDGAALMRGLSEGEYEEAMDKTLQYIRGLADNYEQSLLFVSTLDFLPERVAAGDAADAGLLAAALWERKLAVLLAENLRIHRFPLRELIAGCGRSRFYSRKFWYMGSIPYDMQGLHLLAEEIGKCLSRVKRARCKVLVTDLDNTLWGGVIGEDGVEGIVLDGAHQGAVYQDAQRQLLRMKEQGVLLAVASKNNREDVCAAFAHPQMLLKEEDFAVISCNWEPKAENIAKMANELNLGLDAFVFLDDNEAEREAVRIALPQVNIAGFPTDMTGYADFLAELYETYFFQWRTTGEDREKTGQYRAERMRKEQKEAAVSYEDYLRSLGTKIRIAEVTEPLKERALQLMNKTNQFNTQTLRMEAPELEAYLKSGGRLLLAEVADRYGSSGWTAEFLYHREDDTVTVDNFLMSCRIMGRQIEHAIVDDILQRLRGQGVRAVQAFYKRTAKNKPVEQLWQQFGFAQTNATEDGASFVLKLADYKAPPQTGIHSVIWEAV